MKKILTTLFIAMSVFTTTSFAESCKDKIDDLYNVYDYLQMNLEQMADADNMSEDEKVLPMFCAKVSMYLEMAKYVQTRNDQLKKICDGPGPLNEDNQTMLYFTVMGLSGSKHSCQKEL